MEFKICNIEESELGSDIIRDLSDLLKGMDSSADIKFDKKVAPNTKGGLLLAFAIGLGTSITYSVIYDLLKVAVKRHMAREDFNKKLRIQIEEPERKIEITLEEIIKK